ncbi:unnamed protein product, partial [Brugia timori]|uniref:DUF2384 domain-containing protein n=1 Tax=Brugia timori TaxID=42155 RepID=A0A0R3QFC3_9BILA
MEHGTDRTRHAYAVVQLPWQIENLRDGVCHGQPLRRAFPADPNGAAPRDRHQGKKSAPCVMHLTMATTSEGPVTLVGNDGRNSSLCEHVFLLRLRLHCQSPGTRGATGVDALVLSASPVSVLELPKAAAAARRGSQPGQGGIRLARSHAESTSAFRGGLIVKASSYCQSTAGTLLALTVVEPSPASAQGFDLAAQVRDKAALAVSQFQARAGGRLDYSEQSLATVEEMLAEASPYAKEMPPADVKALVELMGSYILEVGRRQHGGTYQWHEARSQPVLVVGPPKFSVAMMTFDKVRARLSGDPADSIVF